MKTLLLCPELFARESGIQRILRLYLKALCESAGVGDSVDLVVLNDHNLPAAKLANYSNDRLGIRVACGGSKVQFLRAAVRAASGADRLVCGHLGQLIVAWFARSFHPRLEYFLVAHGLEVWKSYSVLERLALRRARRILCVSEYTRCEMQRRIALPDWRFAVVPNALDPFFAVRANQVLSGDQPDDQGKMPKPGGAGSLPATAPGQGLVPSVDLSERGYANDSSDSTSSNGPPLILTVGRLDAAERYKGVDHLIEAMPTVCQTLPGVQLRLIGTGSDRPRLMALAEQRGVSAAVRFPGFVDDQKLVQAYRDCTLFALPSHAEGFGIVFLEAMACGKPCLGARAGAIPELIDDASGMLVDYGNVDQLAAGMVRALTQRWDPEKIKARAAQFSYPAFRTRLKQAMETRPRGRPLHSEVGAG
jgi:glycosyltransferase involved in cell wall biosynthesis